MEAVVIIPVRNQAAYTRSVLEDLKHQELPHRLIVIDNASTDETSNILSCADCDVIVNAEGASVAHSWNQGVQLALRKYKPVYIFILNNDIVLPPWALRSMREILESVSDIGVAAPTFQRNEIAVGFKRLATLAHENFHGTVIPTLHPPGFCFGFATSRVTRLLTDAKLRAKSGFLFEESFGDFWFEDTDFFRRVRALELKLVQCRSVLIHHYESVTLNEREDKAEVISVARERYQAKWDTGNAQR